MFISDYAIRKPIITVTVMLALVVFGIFAFIKLDTDEYPEVNPPIVSVAIPYPGASPDIVERDVVEQIEEGIAGISGIDRITSRSLDGFGLIVAEFDFSKDIQQATQDIRDEISQIRGDLPPEMEEPILTRFDPNDLPIVSLALTSERLNSEQLTRIADPGITRELRGIPGVAEVTVAGKIERELVVNLRPRAMQATGIGVAQVVQALQAQNLSAPVGRVEGDLEERTIRLRGRLDGPADFERLVVSESNGQLTRLGEIADVRDATEEQRTLALFNGEQAVGIDIVKSQNYSTTAVAERVLEKVDEIERGLPQGVVLRTVQNAGVRVAHSVADVGWALFEGALLTVLVVFLFLNSWRSTVITGLALPVSVLASFIAVWAFGFTLNTMSLLGLSLAIGILIDDAIVVRENIVRHVEMGKDHYTAAQEGTAEIGLAVAATTLSIVVVFIPIAFLGGLAGQWFQPFALTIACSVMVSLFVSFSLDPMLSAYWPDPHREEHEKWWITRVLDRFNAWFDRRAEDYKRVIGWALDHRVAMVVLALAAFFGALAIPVKGITGFAVVAAGAFLLLGGLRAYRHLLWSNELGMLGKAAVGTGGVVLTLVILAAVGAGVMAVPAFAKVGGGFFPVQDISEFNVIVETPPGSNLAYTRIKAQEAARLARAKPETLYTYTTIAGQTSEVDRASVYVKLKPKAERERGQAEIEAAMRRELGRIAGATASIAAGNFGGEKQIQLQLQGPDIQVLNDLAEEMVAEVRQVPGAVDVGLSTRGQKPELDVRLERGLAGSLGVTVGQVAQALRPAFAGIDVGDWIDPDGETRDVTVRLEPGARERAADLQALPLIIPAGPGEPSVTVPLGQVASVEQNLGPAQITRLDRERVINVEANVQGRPLSEVLDDIQPRLASVPLPPGYTLTQGGEAQDQQEVFGQIFSALGLAVLLMYFVLVVQFGSFLDPVAILLSLPLSLIGVVLALLITGDTLNLMSLIGVILLMGIVAKNAILLIDFAKWNHEEGMPLREAIIEAGRVRLRPIIMTTFALTAGMLPIAIGAGEGADFRAPLGRAVIGGVLTSTLLTLLVIPTFYEILDEWRDGLFAWIARRRGEPRAPARERAPSALGGAQPMPEAGD